MTDDYEVADDNNQEASFKQRFMGGLASIVKHTWKPAIATGVGLFAGSEYAKELASDYTQYTWLNDVIQFVSYFSAGYLAFGEPLRRKVKGLEMNVVEDNNSELTTIPGYAELIKGVKDEFSIKFEEIYQEYAKTDYVNNTVDEIKQNLSGQFNILSEHTDLFSRITVNLNSQEEEFVQLKTELYTTFEEIKKPLTSLMSILGESPENPSEDYDLLIASYEKSADSGVWKEAYETLMRLHNDYLLADKLDDNQKAKVLSNLGAVALMMYDSNKENKELLHKSKDFLLATVNMDAEGIEEHKTAAKNNLEIAQGLIDGKSFVLECNK